MLTEAYVSVLLVNEELADQVWGIRNAGEADDETACIAWTLISFEIFAQIRAKLLPHCKPNANFPDHI